MTHHGTAAVAGLVLGHRGTRAVGIDDLLRGAGRGFPGHLLRDREQASRQYDIRRRVVRLIPPGREGTQGVLLPAGAAFGVMQHNPASGIDAEGAQGLPVGGGDKGQVVDGGVRCPEAGVGLGQGASGVVKAAVRHAQVGISPGGGAAPGEGADGPAAGAGDGDDGRAGVDRGGGDGHKGAHGQVPSCPRFPGGDRLRKRDVR
ncbi:hypothetical protein P349_04898 [Enterobacter sp. DC4]|nr:hypothetical protein P349_04898 [Enterobacter sp. DC4]